MAILIFPFVKCQFVFGIKPRGYFPMASPPPERHWQVENVSSLCACVVSINWVCVWNSCLSANCRLPSDASWEKALPDEALDPSRLQVFFFFFCLPGSWSGELPRGRATPPGFLPGNLPTWTSDLVQSTHPKSDWLASQHFRTALLLRCAVLSFPGGPGVIFFPPQPLTIKCCTHGRRGNLAFEGGPRS